MNYSIGTTYEGKNFRYLQEIAPFVNHIEVSPDSIANRKKDFVCINEEALKHLKWIENETDISILVHGVGMSIGSYDGCSKEYLQLINELFNKIKKIRWHSEHLAYTMVNGENLGTMLTLPKTDEVIDMICRRVEAIQKKYKIPFLLENVISMLPSPSFEYSDAAFLNKITGLTGCGLILDVYNLECDKVNFNLDVELFLQELNLNTVCEMHLAGGSTDAEFNFQMDVHLGLVAESTLKLATEIIQANPLNLKAITFEILEEFIANHGSHKIINELKKLTSIFNDHEPAAITDTSMFLN